jgi:endonuclease III-like uncharacterized protein
MQKSIIFIIFFLVLLFFQIQSVICEEMINFSELENYAKSGAIEALGRTKSAQAVAPLIGLLTKNTSYLQVAKALVSLNQPSSYDDIIKILDKKVDEKEFDNTFELLTDLLKSQKYVKAQKVFARAYLTLPENEKLIRKFLLDALKAFNMNTSYAVVTTNILNVRQTMNMRGKKIGSIVLGEVVEIIERSPFMQTVDEMEDFWYKIKTDGTLSGWCFGGYLNVLDHTQLPEE